MKASELRINNWIQFRHTETPVRITLGDFVREYNDEHLEDYEPIPLTEKWLKRLGFEIKKGAWGTSAEIRIGGVRYVLYQNGNVWSINPTDGYRVDFKYIHTVQNYYFALTGQELNQNKESKTPRPKLKPEYLKDHKSKFNLFNVRCSGFWGLSWWVQYLLAIILYSLANWLLHYA